MNAYSLDMIISVGYRVNSKRGSEFRSYFLIRLPAHPKTVMEESVEDRHIHTPQVTPQVTLQVEKLINAASGEMTRAELRGALELKDRMHFSRDYLQPALNTGLIEMTIPDKPSSSKQRYRLTNRGRKFVADAGEEASL